MIRTTTLSPVSCIVTRTRVPSGREEWAAVSAFWSKISPLEVRRPSCRPPSQLATPLSRHSAADAVPVGHLLDGGL